MAEGKKSVFKRPEQTSPVLGPEAERFVHGSTLGAAAHEPPAEPRREPATNEEMPEDTSGRQEPMKRLTIDIPLSLHKRVKSQCANQGTTIAEVVRKYLEKKFPEQKQ